MVIEALQCFHRSRDKLPAGVGDSIVVILWCILPISTDEADDDVLSARELVKADQRIRDYAHGNSRPGEGGGLGG